MATQRIQHPPCDRRYVTLPPHPLIRAGSHALSRLAFALLSLSLGACAFQLDRSLEAGEVSGTLMLERVDGVRVPLPGATVRLGDAQLQTLPDGTFAFVGLAAGTHRLQVAADTDDDGEIDAGLKLNVELREVEGGVDGRHLGALVVGGLGEVDGTVRVDGAVAAGAVVVLSSDEGPVAERVTGTDEDGRFRIGALLPGDYLVRVLSRGAGLARTGSAPATITRNTITRLELEADELLPAVAQVGGTVFAEGVETVDVALVAATAVRETVTPGEAFRIGVAPDLYGVKVTAPGMRPLLRAHVLVTADVDLPSMTLEPLPADDERDLDGDGVPASEDADDDGDGCDDADEPEATRFDPLSCEDTDGDGLGDGIDADDDGDGLLDVTDPCPLRADPPGVSDGPAGCLAYDPLVLVVDAPATAKPGEAITVELQTSGTGEIETDLTIEGPGGETADLSEDGPRRWKVTLPAPGLWTLTATALDALDTKVATALVEVTPDPVPLKVPVSVRGVVDEPVVVAVEALEAVEDPVWRWRIEGPAKVTLVGEDSDAVGLTGDTPGEYRLIVELTAGTRTGDAWVPVILAAPPIEVQAPRTAELTAGFPLELAAAASLENVTWTWRDAAGLVTFTEPTSATTRVDAPPGEHVVDVTARRGARSGTQEVALTVFAPGTLSLDEATDDLLARTLYEWVPVTDPALESPVYAIVGDASNGTGATLEVAQRDDGSPALRFRAEEPGVWTWTVTARAGSRAVTGTLTTHVTRLPVEPQIVATPITPVVDETVTMTCSADAIPDVEEATWTWTPAASNPQPVTLANAPAVSFSAQATGTFLFDCTATLPDGRTGTKTIAVTVGPRDGLHVTVEWWENRAGNLLWLYAETAESTTDAEWTFAQAPSNPAALDVAKVGEGEAVAYVAEPGLYRFTATVRTATHFGSYTFDVPVAPRDSGLTVTIGADASATSVGNSIGLWLDSSDSLDAPTYQWAADPANPAPVSLPDESWMDFTPDTPGVYRFTGTVTDGEQAGSATVELRVYPGFEITATWTGGITGGPLRLQGVVDGAPAEAPRWSWTLTSRPDDAPATSLMQNKTAAPYLSAGATAAGTWVFDVTATGAVQSGSAQLVVEVVDPPRTRTLELPDLGVHPVVAEHRAAVGVPFRLKAFCPDCFEPTYAWAQADTDPVQVTFEGATEAELSFVPPQNGQYAFTVEVTDFGNFKRTATVEVDVTQGRPDVYVDGHPGARLTTADRYGHRVWACRSGRSDAVSATWTKVGGDVDGQVITDGEWLVVQPESFRHPISGWKCTITTADGGEHALVVPIVPIASNRPDRVFFATPSNDPAPVAGDCDRLPLAPGCKGTWDDPWIGFGQGLYGGFANFDPRVVVLLAGTQTIDRTYGATADAILGSVDPATFAQDVAAHPSVLRWEAANYTTPLFTLSNGSRFDGVVIEATAAEASVRALTAIRAPDAATITRNVIELIATTQAVKAIELTHVAGTTPLAVAVSNNLVRVTGGTGQAALTDRCRGTLWAHNLVALSADSGLLSAFALDCSGTHSKRPAHLVNNVVFAANGQAGFDLDGAPATDAGHHFAGNWFAGTGPFVVADSPALSLTTAEDVDAALSGGGNSTDEACFPDPLPALLASTPAAACANPAVRPDATLFGDLTSLGVDHTGTARDLETGWSDADATLSIGPRQR